MRVCRSSSSGNALGLCLLEVWSVDVPATPRLVSNCALGPAAAEKDAVNDYRFGYPMVAKSWSTFIGASVCWLKESIDTVVSKGLRTTEEAYE